MSPDAEDGSPSPGPGVDRESSSIMAEEKIERASTDEISPARTGPESKPPPKSNPKDPSRPRRKKARRACFACQRAHLTCGDERPCLRCIKRGLQDQCHDGVRKKAKYLHDAPPEALMPGFPPNQYSANGSQNTAPPNPGSSQMAQNGIAISQPPNFMPPTPSGSFPQFNPVNHAARMGAPMMEGNDPMLGGNFGQNVEASPQYQSTPTQVSPVQTIPGSMDQPPTIETSNGQSYDQSFMDPNDPSLFNFDISGLNFGNHYGALEFGMLGHMSSGAVGTSEGDLKLGGQSHHGLPFDNPAGYNQNGNFNFNQFPGWQGLTRQTSNNNVWTASSNGMDAFAIGESSIVGQSPASQNQDFNNYPSGANMSPENQFAQVEQNHNPPPDLLRQSFSQPSQQQQQPSQRKQLPAYNNGGGQQRKRRRDISEIYSSVTAPYPYTQGFHALTAFLQRRFPTKKTLRIAKALASIRPSFISCNKNLGHEDLIFMEKCFQRTLCEYEDFVNHYGTPTIICRRTGEIASVSKEFSLVTGWRRDVLLGQEPNLNVNTGSNVSGTQTGTSSRGAVTPRAPNVDIDPGRPQPVFLAELMDEDSVVQFYEDFAELAFGASRASIMGRTLSLLKYKTKDDAGWGVADFTEDGNRSSKRPSSGEVKMDSLMKGELGTKTLGDGDGQVKGSIECSMCWTVKRDVFDIPMLIVMNFLPII